MKLNYFGKVINLEDEKAGLQIEAFSVALVRNTMVNWTRLGLIR